MGTTNCLSGIRVGLVFISKGSKINNYSITNIIIVNNYNYIIKRNVDTIIVLSSYDTRAFGIMTTIIQTISFNEDARILTYDGIKSHLYLLELSRTSGRQMRLKFCSEFERHNLHPYFIVF